MNINKASIEWCLSVDSSLELRFSHWSLFVFLVDAIFCLCEPVTSCGLRFSALNLSHASARPTIQIVQWHDIARAGSQPWLNLLSGNQISSQITARVAILGLPVLRQVMKKWQKVFVLQQGNEKSSKDYEKTRSCGWDKNWRINCPWLEYDEDNDMMYCSWCRKHVATYAHANRTRQFRFGLVKNCPWPVKLTQMDRLQNKISLISHPGRSVDQNHLKILFCSKHMGAVSL